MHRTGRHRRRTRYHEHPTAVAIGDSKAPCRHSNRDDSSAVLTENLSPNSQASTDSVRPPVLFIRRPVPNGLGKTMQDVRGIVARESIGYERRSRKLNGITLKQMRNHASAHHDVIHRQATSLPSSQVIVDVKNHENFP